ncbi:hypothetical protein IscW_ISCW014250 [Ixodes scapularis]|uniref:Uncharacterized protein n=1 Tax=Ixodes scapularis TaxID=6945 RepID=B7QGQ9_IXOSC|nr:hypothetical protein IscW_ISCW014250 [Ixodes scapularis]|eukprot:XP_002400545.1 hypothetical protein IscW_ISCW014250 [Ixodes scapularis]
MASNQRPSAVAPRRDTNSLQGASLQQQVDSGHARAGSPPRLPGKRWRGGRARLTWRGSSVRGTWQQRRPTRGRCSEQRSMLPEVQRGGWQNDDRGAEVGPSSRADQRC